MQINYTDKMHVLKNNRDKLKTNEQGLTRRRQETAFQLNWECGGIIESIVNVIETENISQPVSMPPAL
jgi:hypothetical protein